MAARGEGEAKTGPERLGLVHPVLHVDNDMVENRDQCGGHGAIPKASASRPGA